MLKLAHESRRRTLAGSQDSEVWAELEKYFGGKIELINHIGVTIGRPTEVFYAVVLTQNKAEYADSSSHFSLPSNKECIQFVTPYLKVGLTCVHANEAVYWTKNWSRDTPPS